MMPVCMPACLAYRQAYIGSGLTADGGQHIITPDEYGGGPLGLRGRTAKNDNDPFLPLGTRTLSSHGCN